LHVAWDDQLASYDFGAGHPLAPLRVLLTIELARAFGLLAADGVSVERPTPATDGHLEMVHVQPYIAAVRHAGDPQPDPSVLGFGPAGRDLRLFRSLGNPRAME
jgi:acetoin utilization protein AcuC